jgi:alpha-tubulin suppressor-like RCC1 family protein
MRALRTIAFSIVCSITALFCFCQSARAQSSVWAWGDNQYGELGNGTYTTSSTPVQVLGTGGVGDLTGVTALAGGIWHSLALKNDGTVWAWGDNQYGELGNGTYTTTSPYGIDTPEMVSGLTGITAIAIGEIDNLALKSDGTVWAWGYNGYGDLGNGTYTSSKTPVQVLGPGGVGFLTGVTALAGGGYSKMALKSDGTVWAWGYNSYGELGNGTYTNSNTPVQVLGPSGVGYLSGVTAIAGGEASNLALKSNGTVWAWGDGGNGELGNGTFTSTINTPVQVLGPGGAGSLTGVTAIAEGSLLSLALTSNGTVLAWGYSGYGQLGNGTDTDSNTPVEVSGLSGVTAIASGDGGFYSLALTSAGTVWAWGDNGYGQLGNGTDTDSSTPVEVSGLSGVMAIGTGLYHGLALKATPSQAIESLIAQVTGPGLGLSPANKAVLLSVLVGEQFLVNGGYTADAIAGLKDFISIVNDLVILHQTTATAAAPLISAAKGTLAEL